MASDRPLTAEHRRDIDRAMSRLNSLTAWFDRLEACGVDCSERRAVAQYEYEQLGNVLRHVFGVEPGAVEFHVTGGS